MMPAALLGVALAGVFAAFLGDMGRSAVLLARSRLAATRGLLAADACLARTAASVPAGWELEPLLAGPDGTFGTVDDGSLLAPAGCHVTVTLLPGPTLPARLLLRLTAGEGRSRRELAAVIARAVPPGVAALLWFAQDARPGTVGGSLLLDGRDDTDPQEPVLAPLATSSDPAPFDAWLSTEPVVVPADPARPIVGPAPPLAELIQRAGDAAPTPPETGLGPSNPLPALMLAAGSLEILHPTAGAGVLVVPGLLDIRAPFEFTGVVVAAGGLWLRPGAVLEVRGAVWLGPGPGGDPALRVDGVGIVRARRAALEQADRLLPLPRPVRIMGIRDG